MTSPFDSYVLLSSQPVDDKGISLTWQECGAIGSGRLVAAPVPPSSIEQVRQQLKDMFVPSRFVALLPQSWLPKAVFFDMDSTVVEEESIVELAKAAGCEAAVAALTEQAMAGKLDFKAALTQRLALIAGLSFAEVDRAAEGLTLTPGVEALIGGCKQAEIATYLVSGGFTQFAERVAGHLGMSGCHANILQESEGKLTGHLVGTVVDAEEKSQFVKAICSQNGWLEQDVMVVGDGANDLLMMARARVSVGFRPKKTLWPHLQVYNGVGDHTLLWEALSFSSSQPLG